MHPLENIFLSENIRAVLISLLNLHQFLLDS